jgi:hypothetical protein
VRRLIQVMQESWNHLILLDACRYDVFAQCWNRFFPAGRLECGDSIGTATVEWRDRSFPNQYPDVVYVSSNPYINSRKPALGFYAPDHFHAIVDVWATDWDSTAGTVYPDKVTRAALGAHRDFPDKRLIVHYIQPHAPYISQAGSLPGFPVPNIDNGNILVGIPDMSAETPRQRKWFRRFLPIVDAFLPEPASWSLAQWLGMPPRSPMDAMRRRLGRRGLRQAYQANLEAVLKEVIGLVESLPGRIVITADHGERLGELGNYSHRAGSSSRYLRQVPWLVIDRPHKSHTAPHHPPEPPNSPSPEPTSPEDQARIEERLRALGYVE